MTQVLDTVQIQNKNMFQANSESVHSKQVKQTNIITGVSEEEETGRIGQKIQRNLRSRT